MDVPLYNQSNHLFPWITRPFQAIYNLLASPPMTEQGRTSRAIKEAYIIIKMESLGM